jgi:hypothetical protein
MAVWRENLGQLEEKEMQNPVCICQRVTGVGEIDCQSEIVTGNLQKKYLRRIANCID